MADYRHASLRCPSCREVLVEEFHGRAHVDVCRSCGGMWVDWMDGDIRSVSRAVEVPPRAPASPPSVGACPICAASLSVEVIDAIAEVHRCGSCAGAFVPKRAADALARAQPADEDDPALTRLLDRLGRWLLGSSTFVGPI